MDTTILFKTKKTLKRDAQKAAAAIGVPLSTVLNLYLRKLVQDQSVTFSAPQLNAKSRKVLDKRLKEVRDGKTVGPFTTAKAFIDELNT